MTFFAPAELPGWRVTVHTALVDHTGAVYHEDYDSEFVGWMADSQGRIAPAVYDFVEMHFVPLPEYAAKHSHEQAFIDADGSPCEEYVTVETPGTFSELGGYSRDLLSDENRQRWISQGYREVSTGRWVKD